MRFLVRATFHKSDAAQKALDALVNLGYREKQIAFRTRLANLTDAGTVPEGYDPIGGARLTGRPVLTLSSTGHDLVGNSTTLSVPIDQWGEILAQAAADEETGSEDESVRLRIDTLVETDERRAAEAVREVLRGHGARSAKIDTRQS